MGPFFGSFFGSWTNGAVLDVWFSFSSESLPRSLLRGHVHLNDHGQSKRKAPYNDVVSMCVNGPADGLHEVIADTLQRNEYGLRNPSIQCMAIHCRA